MGVLPLDEVRRMARETGFQEVHFNGSSRLISFQRGDVRVNIYYTTGTVATCIDHPRQGKTQLFRRDVDLVILWDILNDPRVHTDRGYQRGRQRSRSRDRSPPRGGGGGGGAGPGAPGMGDEESEALANLARLKAEKEDLDQRVAEAQAFVDVYERRREEEAERKRREAADVAELLRRDEEYEPQGLRQAGYTPDQIAQYMQQLQQRQQQRWQQQQQQQQQYDRQQQQQPPAHQGGRMLNVPRDTVGRVIGRQGATVKQIRQLSGARITIRDGREGAPTRPVYIDSDDPFAVAAAELLIHLAASGVDVSGWQPRDVQEAMAQQQQQSHGGGGGGGGMQQQQQQQQEQQPYRDEYGQHGQYEQHQMTQQQQPPHPPGPPPQPPQYPPPQYGSGGGGQQFETRYGDGGGGGGGGGYQQQQQQQKQRRRRGWS